MIRPPPISTPTDTLFPYTTLFRSPAWGTVADMLVIAWPPSSLLTLPEQAQQQLEQVAKIEIERQRAHHGQLVRPLGSRIGLILALQTLGVPSGEPRKNQHAGDQSDSLTHRRPYKQGYTDRADAASQTHKQPND